MSLQISEKDFRFYLYMLKLLSTATGSAAPIDFSGLTTQKYYDSIYENGAAAVCVPLVSAANDCDNIDFEYNLTEFATLLTSIDNAFETYFSERYGNPDIDTIGEFMLDQNLSVSAAVDSFYYDLIGKHFYSGTVFKPEDTVHYTLTYASSTQTWTGAYTVRTYSGGVYDLNSTSGLMTKPQKMKLRASLNNLLVLATFETTGEDYKMLAYLDSAGTYVTTETEVLGIKTIEILNSQVDQLDHVPLVNNASVSVRYTAVYENNDAFTLETSAVTEYPEGTVTSGKPGSYIIQDPDFKYLLYAEGGVFSPEFTYYFKEWTNGGSNPKYNSYPTTEDIPIFGLYKYVNTLTILDGAESSATDISIEYVGKQPVEPTGTKFLAGTVKPTAIYDDTKYRLESIEWSDDIGGSVTILNGESFEITEAMGSVSFTFTFKTVAFVVVTTNLTTLPDGYTFNSRPLPYTVIGGVYVPAGVVGDVVDVKSFITEGLPTQIHVFNRWSDAAAGDYSAIKTSQTLVAGNNNYVAEYRNLGASVAEHSIVFHTGNNYPSSHLYDMTNLSASGAAVELTKTVGANPDVPYAVYHGSNILFRFEQVVVVPSILIELSLDGNLVYTSSGGSTPVSFDIVLENITADHSIELLLTSI